MALRLPQRKESSIEQAVTRWCRAQGLHFTPKLQGAGNKGLPDRLILLPGGRVFFIEFKNHRGTTTLLQEYTINELRKLGFDVEVHNCATDAIKAIILRMDPARVSEAGYPFRHSKRRRGPADGHGSGEDGLDAGGPVDPEAEGVD